MKFLTLKQIKAQCRIEEDFTMEDTKLTLYGDSAEQAIFNMCQRSYEDFIEMYGAIPQDVVYAALLLVTASYEHNAAVSMQITVKVINMSENDVDADFVKADCIMTDDGASYVVLVDSEELGIGTLMLRLTVYMPDTDYQSGTRKEVIKINPHIRITG